MNRVLNIAAVGIAIAGTSASAFALAPETSSLVSTTTVVAPHAVNIDGTTAYYGIAECEAAYSDDSVIETTFTTLVDPTETSGSQERLAGIFTFTVARDAGSAVTCPSDACTDVDNGDYSTTTSTVRASIPFRGLVGISAASACDGFDGEFFTRINLREADADDTTVVPTDSRIIVDTVRPQPPTNFTFEVTENKISANWELSSDDDVTRYGVYYSTTPFTGGTLADGSLGSAFVTGDDRTSNDFTVSLSGDDTVYVAMVAVDETGNESVLSEVQSATVVQTQDFWELYQAAGGQEEGGCNAAGGAAGWLLLGFAGLLGRRRRGRKMLAAALPTVAAGALMLSPADASAASPVTGSLDLKLGGYYPAIDDEFGGAGPYAAAFGSDWRFYTEFEVGFYFWQGFGKLGTSYHLGYSSATGNALTADGTSSSDETSFTIIPNRASLVYRFDELPRRFNVPLALVGKVGLDYVLWYSDGGDGSTSQANGKTASGGKMGYHAALSGQFLLDVIDPASAATFDMNWGVNNSYLFAEYMIASIDDFGGAGLDLSDNMWLFGLSFEY